MAAQAVSEGVISTNTPIIDSLEYEVRTIVDWCRDKETRVIAQIVLRRMANLTVSGTINSPARADDVYSILTDYDRLPQIFHNVDSCTFEESDDGRKDSSEMVTWKFLIFKGSFVTELRVIENYEECQLSFSLIKSAFMESFVGTWEIEEDSNSGLSIIRHSLSINPIVRPPQKIGDITKKIFETKLKEY